MNSHKNYAQVMFDFEANYADELSAKSGDIIQVLYGIDEEWVYAKFLINSSYEGILPLNYIRLIDIPESIPLNPNYSYSAASKPILFLAISDFDLVEQGDLVFKKGDLLVGQRNLDENWSHGYSYADNSRIGIFPMTHVIKINLNDTFSETNLVVSNNQQIRNTVNEEAFSIKAETETAHVAAVTSSTETNDTRFNLRQAKAIHNFDNTSYSNDSSYNYLKLTAGDYLLIMKKLDDNWLIGENSAGDKGLFPLNCIELIQDRENELSPNPILNRTQRRFTIMFSDDKHQQQDELVFDKFGTTPNLSSYANNGNNGNNSTAESREDTQSFSSFASSNEDPVTSSNYNPYVNDTVVEFMPTIVDTQVSEIEQQQPPKTCNYCRVNFDFHPENKNELGCFKGEYLKIKSGINEEWLDCLNYYNKSGIVPGNFVTLLDDGSFAKDLFENQSRASTTSLNNSQKVSNGGGGSGANTIMSEILAARHSMPVQESMPSYSANFDGGAKNQLPLVMNVPLFENKYERSSSSSQVVDLKVPETTTVKTRSLTPETPNELAKSNRKSGPKPPIPPKPSIALKPRIPPKPTIQEAKPPPQLKIQPAPPVENLAIVKPEIPPKSTINDIGDQVASSDSDKRQTKRRFIVTELVDTERTYLNELKRCYAAFMGDNLISFENTPQAKVPADFDRNSIFDNLNPVIECSRLFLKLVDFEMSKNESKYEKINIAKCLNNCVEDMKSTYAKYARSHNTVALLVKKYESTPSMSEFIKERLGAVNPTNSFSLSTLMIKPVQRIFKYPLFLNRLIENAEKSDPDYDDLVNASKNFTEMLEFINEYKRRKDLINKYLATNEQTENTITEKMKKLNMHSIRKKSNRFRMGLSNMLGLINTHVYDAKFDRIEINYRLVDKTVRGFHANVEAYLVNLREVLDCEKNIFNTLLYVFEDDFTTFARFELSINSMRSSKYNVYSEKIMKLVLTPLIMLETCLNGPNKLIEKRYDKLLDYESALNDIELRKSSLSPGSPLSRELDLNLEKTKKDYEAMNYQLVEELPALALNSTRVLSACVRTFLKITGRFVRVIDKNFKDNVNSTYIDFNMVVQDNHTQRISALGKINTINTNFSSSRLSLPAKLTEHQPSQLHATFTQQKEDQRQKILKKYSKDKIYVVTQIYVGNEKFCQLQQAVNDIVGLIKPFDANNQPHMWFVDNGEREGFVPSQALTPFSQHGDNLNLIDLEDDDKKRKEAGASSQRTSNVDLLSEFLSPPLPVKLPVTDEIFCIALYNFKAIAPNMINLQNGEIYKVIEKFDKKNNPDWWFVEYNGNRGYVPCSYVKLLD